MILNKRHGLLIFFATIGLALSFVALYPTRQQPIFHPTHPFVLNGQPIDLEIVTSTKDMAQGLGDRQDLPNRHGMLFVYASPGIHPFWMRHMHVPIDIIWIHEGRVVDIAHRLPPPRFFLDPPTTYHPQGAATWVLEIPAGSTRQYGLEVNGRVDLAPSS